MFWSCHINCLVIFVLSCSRYRFGYFVSPTIRGMYVYTCGTPTLGTCGTSSANASILLSLFIFLFFRVRVPVPRIVSFFALLSSVSYVFIVLFVSSFWGADTPALTGHVRIQRPPPPPRFMGVRSAPLWWRCGCGGGGRSQRSAAVLSFVTLSWQ